MEAAVVPALPVQEAVAAHLEAGKIPSALVDAHLPLRRICYVNREVLELLAYATLELEQAQAEADG